MTRRINKWQTALDAAFKEREFKPFGWGGQDCCLFAADCVFAVTGVDPAEDLRGTYSNEFEAARVLASEGGVVGVAARRAGPEISVQEAQVGDIVLVLFDGRETLTVCGGMMLYAPGPTGLVHLPRGQGLRAWRCTRAD